MTDSKTEENAAPETETPAMTDDQGTLGAIQIAVPVVENMVRMITSEVEGVVDVIGGASGAISGIFSGKTENRTGVKVVEDEAGAYAIEVRVSLEFGVELANVAYEIQTKIIESISKMTSKGVSKVDVFIDKVEKAQEAKDEAPVEASKPKKKASPKTEQEKKPESE